MKKLLILIILVSYSFGITDILYKPVVYSSTLSARTLYSVTSYYPEYLSSSIYKDDKNIFIYSGHFRVIYGISYEDSILTRDLANTILSAANEVWNKEIDEFGFKAPKNSEKYYIDIYIGNRSAYNKDSGSYMNISSYYAGYATAYSDGTPYFVINPSIDIDILKVTIAHEFFHTIQYAYGLGDVSNEIWYKNLWFMEATATMMEDEVFDYVNDYVNFIKYYINSTYKSIEYYNSAVEYGKVIFAKYLKEKYGLNFIKSFFESYSVEKSALDVLKEKFIEENSSFTDEMLEFGTWMANKDSFFEEGTSYPSLYTFDLDDNLSVEEYGLVFINRGSDRYLISSNPEYAQCNFKGEKDLIDNVDINGLIFLNTENMPIYTDISKNNKFNGYSLKAGWNMVSNILDANLSLEDLFVNNEIVWLFRDGKYYAYSADSTIQKVIEEKNIDIPDNQMLPGEGAWVYVENDEVIDFTNEKVLGFNFNLKEGWNFISIASSSFDINKITEPVIIWFFNKESGNWEYYTNLDIELSYEKIDKIIPGNGYFVYFYP